MRRWNQLALEQGVVKIQSSFWVEACCWKELFTILVAGLGLISLVIAGFYYQELTLSRIGLFGSACRYGEAHFPKICQTCHTIMKLGKVIPYLKKIQKVYNHVTHHLSFTDISIFHWKSATFVILRNTDIDCIVIYNLQFF